jgi:hypothetical protein
LFRRPRFIVANIFTREKRQLEELSQPKRSARFLLYRGEGSKTVAFAQQFGRKAVALAWRKKD